MALLAVGLGLLGTLGLVVGIASSGKADREDADFNERRRAHERDEAEKKERRNQRRAEALDQIMGSYGLPTGVRSRLVSWAEGGDEGLGAIQEALARGTSEPANRLREYDDQRLRIRALEKEIRGLL